METQTQIQEPKTVKFQALVAIKEAEKCLQSAIMNLEIARDLKGDNEAQEFAEALIISIEKDRKTLHRGYIEASELW